MSASDLYDFNPHHRKVVTRITLRTKKSSRISIHTTARWWQVNASIPCHSKGNFNPHHRKVVTVFSCQKHYIRIISIHTTARLWLKWHWLYQLTTWFQSTPPQGGDVAERRQGTQIWTISIHTTARWWRSPQNIINPSGQFQSTPPQGGDQNSGANSSSINRFQSTPPQGGDF